MYSVHVEGAFLIMTYKGHGIMSRPSSGVVTRCGSDWLPDLFSSLITVFLSYHLLDHL
jgi:hypothetical protein